MKRLVISIICTVAILIAPVALFAADHVIDKSKNPQFLFVLSAESGTYADGKLTLDNVPLVVYFSDRPKRIAGHMSLERLIDSWNKGSDSFKKDPPNATLSIFDENGNKNIVLELQKPIMSGKTISFNVRALQGSVPSEFAACSLFIDISLMIE
jgi:hypothetical protein